MNPYQSINDDVELEEIKIKGSNSRKSSLRGDNTDTYGSYSETLTRNQQSLYTPTVTSVVNRKKTKKEGFNSMNEMEEDSDEEQDKKARIKRNMNQGVDKPFQHEEIKPTRIGVDDSQLFDDFDWFADDYINEEKDDEKSEDEDKDSSLTFKFSKIPKTIRYWIYLILGDIIFIIPIVLLLYFDCLENNTNPTDWKLRGKCESHDCNNKCNIPDSLRNIINIFDYPISTWALWLIPTWSVFWILKICIHLIPSLVIRIVDFLFGYVPKKILNFADYIRFLQKYIVYAIASLLSWVFLNIFFKTNKNKYLEFIDSLLSSIVVACGIWAIEKIILQSFSISFHKSVYEDRIDEIDKAIRVLEYLNESKHKSNKSEVGSPVGSKDGLNKNKIYNKVANIAKNVVLKGTNKTRSVLLRSSWDAKMLARNLYYQLGGTDRIGDELTIENFKEFFATEKEAQDAFDLFDKDGNGDLSKSEIKGFVLGVYNDQKTLRKSMKDSNIALRKLDMLFKFISIIIIIITTLTIFGCNLSSVYVALSSIWVGTMFAISGTITNLVKSLIFLFITHPFDVGDRIEIDGQAYLVKDFGLTNVTMKKPNGEEIYAPTSELTSKFINNIRRSSPLIQVFNITVNSKSTTAKQIEALQERLQKFVDKESRNFQGRCVVSATDILDELRMNLAIIVQHKHNGQDAIRVRQRNDLFVGELKSAIKDLNLQLPNPSLLFINIANDDGDMTPYETRPLE